MLLPDKKDSVLQWKHLQLVSELVDRLHKVNTAWKRLKWAQGGGIFSILKAQTFAAVVRLGLSVEIIRPSLLGRLIQLFVSN